jgi:GT2 family glycosyltransferase
VDDDAIPDPNVLETLMQYINGGVGAIGGSILTHQPINTITSTGLIENIDNEQNIQWGYIENPKQVEHLHCSFLYRANVYDYNLGLSRVAHREETLFTYGLHQKGYQLLVVPNAITWHFKNPQGGIRSENNEAMYQHDEQIFKNFMDYKDHTIVVLNCGMGDHIVFSHVLPLIKNPIVFSCYPEIVPGQSISDAYLNFRNIDHWNIYKKMDQWQWQNSLENAFRKLYQC